MIGRAAVCGIVLFALDVLVSGQSTDRPQPTAQTDRISQRIRALQSEADRLAGESRTLLGDLRKLEVEQQQLTQKMSGPDYHRLAPDEMRRDGERAVELESLIAERMERWIHLEERT